ncbi:MAG: mucoidy inhibitor MuiA family protein [Nannocystaceae bacterium]
MATLTTAPQPNQGAEAEAAALALPVDEVILLEDRAHVIRRGVVEVPAGTSRFVVAEVTPVLSDRTLCAALRRGDGEEVSGARVQDLRLRRRQVARLEARPEEAQRIARQRLEVSERAAQLKTRHARASERLEWLGSLAEGQLADAATDAAWGRSAPERWGAELAEIRRDEAAARGELLALAEELAELHEELQRLGRLAAAKADVREEVVAELVIEVVARAPGRFRLQVDYIVPGACWRPYHRAELVEPAASGEGGPTLAFACEGCVWQRTGEDWRDVQLVFSTERLSLGSEPPTLDSDVLRVTRRREVIEVELRDQEIQTAGLGGESRPAAELPGIDDGGEALELRASRRVDVRSDGRPHRAPLFAFASEAALDRVLLGELDPAVILKSAQVNRAKQPLLAGPVDLVRGGGFVGRTSILFIAAGERFELGWGPDAAVRALREVELLDEEKGMLSSWTATVHAITLRLSNLGAEPRRIKVSERVPISEIEKVKIELDRRKTTSGAAPDDNGILTWDVDLGAFERRRLELRYTLRRHGDVSGV